MSVDAWGGGSDNDPKLRNKENENRAMHAARIEFAKRAQLAKALAHREREQQISNFLFTVVLIVGVGALSWAVVHSEWWQRHNNLAVEPVAPYQAPTPMTTPRQAAPAVNQPETVNLGNLNQETLNRICRTSSPYSTAACLLWSQRDQEEARERQQALAQADASAIARRNQEIVREANRKSQPAYAPQYSQSGIEIQKSARLASADHQCDPYGPGLIAERECRANLAKSLRDQCREITSSFNISAGSQREFLRNEREISCYASDNFRIVKS